MRNEGLLFKKGFGGCHIYTEEHPPVILSGLIDVTKDYAVGTVLTLSNEGKITPATAESTSFIGVSDEDVAAGEQNYLAYVVHGTVVADMLILEDGSPFTEYSELMKMGVYPL